MDGTLDEAAEAAVRAHLETCGRCSDELAALESVVAGVRDLPPAAPPADFLGQLHDRMERGGRLKQALEKMFVPFRIKIPLQAAAAGAVAVLVFLVMQTPQMQKELEQGPAKMQVRERVAEKQAYDGQTAGDAVPLPEPDAAKETGAAETPAAQKAAGDAVMSADREKAPAPSAPMMEQAAEGRAAADRSAETDKKITGSAGGKMKALKTAPEKMTERAAPAGKAAAPAERRAPAPEAGQAGKAKEPAAGAETVRPERAGRAVSEGRKLSPRARGQAGEGRALFHEAGPDASSLKEEKRYVAQERSGRDHPVVKKVTALAGKVSGKVVSVAYREGTGVPETMTVDIPSDRYEGFCRALKEAGTGKVTGTSPRGPSMVRVRISLPR